MKNIFATAEAFALAALTPLVRVGREAEALFLGKVDLGNGHSATIMIPEATAKAFALVTEIEAEDGHKYPAVDAALDVMEAFARAEFKALGQAEVSQANGKEAEHVAADMDSKEKILAENVDAGARIAREGASRPEDEGEFGDAARRGFDSVMAEFHKGEDLAKAGEALPEDAGVDVRRGFESAVQAKEGSSVSGAAAVESGAVEKE